jgi:outer membrane receptor protein involved in Fe transport
MGVDRIESSLYVRRLDTTIKANVLKSTNGVTESFTESKSYVLGPIITGGKLFAVKSWWKITSTLGIDFYHEDRIGSEGESVVTNFNTNGSVKSVKITPRAKNVPDSNQINIGVFAHHDWDPTHQWTFSAGSRVDRFESKTDASPFFDPKLEEIYKNAKPKTEIPVTGSLGMIYRPWSFLHWTANMGRSFRVPATVESFASSKFGAGFFVPNPDLESEEGLTYEIGTRLRFNKFHANLTAFYSEYKNFIERRSITFLGLPSSQSQNTGEAEVRGFEMDAAWNLTSTWKISSNMTAIHGTDITNDRPLTYIPPLKGSVSVRYTMEKIESWIEMVNKWSLEKNRIDPTKERKTAKFSIFNLYAGKELGTLFPVFPEMRLQIGLENLFDTIYRQPTTTEDINFSSSLTNPLVEPGFSVSVGLTSKF